VGGGQFLFLRTNARRVAPRVIQRFGIPVWRSVAAPWSRQQFAPPASEDRPANLGYPNSAPGNSQFFVHSRLLHPLVQRAVELSVSEAAYFDPRYR